MQEARLASRGDAATLLPDQESITVLAVLDLGWRSVATRPGGTSFRVPILRGDRLFYLRRRAAQSVSENIFRCYSIFDDLDVDVRDHHRKFRSACGFLRERVRNQRSVIGGWGVEPCSARDCDRHSASARLTRVAAFNAIQA